MVPEGLLEGAALSAPEPVADGNPEAEAEAAESAEVTVEGSTGFNWADASEDAPELTTDQVDVGGACKLRPRRRGGLRHLEVRRTFIARPSQT